MKFNVEQLRADFPILSKKVNGHPFIYLDSGATSLTPRQVTNQIVNYYENYNANYSRGVATLSSQLTLKIEDVRKKIAQFIGVNDEKNIVFTKNATESINILAHGLEHFLQEGDEIVISEQEHHANILPWIVLAQKTGAILKYIPINHDGTLKIETIPQLVTTKTRIFALNQISSTLGYINDVTKIATQVKELANCFVIIDGAQSCGHIDVKLDANIDAFVFSAHKMFGPTGVGVLYISDEFANVVEPLNFGGQMVDLVTKNKFSTKNLPFKYEAGTLNLAGIFGLGAAIDYINSWGIQNISDHIEMLTRYFYENISQIQNVYFFNDLKKAHGIISFNINNVHSHESSSDLDKVGIQTRAGEHCSQIYFSKQTIDNNVRISLYAYNTTAELDYLIKSLKKIAKQWDLANNEQVDYQQVMEELKKLKQGG